MIRRVRLINFNMIKISKLISSRIVLFQLIFSKIISVEFTDKLLIKILYLNIIFSIEIYLIFNSKTNL